MQKMRKSLAVLLALALAAGIIGATGCSKKDEGSSSSGTKSTETAKPSPKLVKDGVLTVGSDTAFPPFESMNGDVAEGFDVDLISAIAKEIGLTAKVDTVKFDTLIPLLKAGGKFDIVVSAMTITPERQQEIDFSSPYIDSNQSIAVKKGAFAKIAAGDVAAIQAAFAGKTIGVQSGTTGEAWAKENLQPKGAKIVPFDDTLAAFSALSAGKVDAVVNDLPVSAWIVKDPARGAELVAEIPTGEQYGFGISKDNPELKKAVDDAIAKLKSDGTYDAIYKKWFGTSPSGQ